MELLEVVDENNKLTGEIKERNIIHEKGIWHREVVVWVMNENGEMLLQKRASTKKQEPNKWGLCAGHIDAGETTENALLRELEEELGIKTTIEQLDFLKISKSKKDFPNDLKNYVFYYIYLLKTDWKIEDYKINLEELSEVKYVPFEQIEGMVRNKDKNITFVDRDDILEVIELLKGKR